MAAITWEDFEKVEIRVGTVLDVQPFPKARKPAYQLTIDFGPHGKRRSSAQVTSLYGPADLLPKQIANFFSECLVLGVVGNAGEVALLQPEGQWTTGCGLGESLLVVHCWLFDASYRGGLRAEAQREPNNEQPIPMN
jgi:tRNA-binding protein